jgi:hypothetical protein
MIVGISAISEIYRCVSAYDGFKFQNKKYD